MRDNVNADDYTHTHTHARNSSKHKHTPSICASHAVQSNVVYMRDTQADKPHTNTHNNTIRDTQTAAYTTSNNEQ